MVPVLFQITLILHTTLFSKFVWPNMFLSHLVSPISIQILPDKLSQIHLSLPSRIQQADIMASMALFFLEVKFVFLPPKSIQTHFLLRSLELEHSSYFQHSSTISTVLTLQTVSVQ